MAALVAVNFAIVGARLADAAGPDANPDVVIVEEVPDDTVLIVAPDGSTMSVDPSTAEGKKAIADAKERGDTIVTTPPDGSRAAGIDSSPAVAAKQSASELDAADGVVDGIIHVVDEQTGEVVEVATNEVDQDGDGNVDTPETPSAPGGDDSSSDDDGGDGNEPLVSVTTPGATVTTPGATVTTPGATVTTPPVTVSTPITTVTVPTTTVTVPTTTVTVPTTTVTVPTTTVTVTTTTTVAVTTTTAAPTTTTAPTTIVPPVVTTIVDVVLGGLGI